MPLNGRMLEDQYNIWIVLIVFSLVYYVHNYIYHSAILYFTCGHVAPTQNKNVYEIFYSYSQPNKFKLYL